MRWKYEPTVRQSPLAQVKATFDIRKSDALIREPAGEHLNGRDSERVQIRPDRHLTGWSGLRREVEGCASVVGGCTGVRVEYSRGAEVSKHGILSFLIKKNVAWLDVAV
jgi:hypothetical protein